MIELEPLTDTFGALVRGIDLAASIPCDLAGALRGALHERQVLLFRGGPLSPAAQLAVTSMFGTVTPPWDSTHAHPDDAQVEVFHGSHARSYKRPAEHWHTDASFLATPTDATLLHALVVPAQGGRTSFLDARAALAALPGDLRAAVTPLMGVHDFSDRFSGLRVAAARVSGDDAERERVAFPPSRHPLVRPHPVTGVPALYLNELCLRHIEGMTVPDSDALLAQLYEHALNDRWRYSHQWQVGDLLVWDNPSLLHRGEPVPVSQDRLVHRTTAAYHRPRG